MTGQPSEVRVPAASIRENIEAIYPLTPIQKGMVFHSLLKPGSGAYVLQDCLRLQGPLNVEAFWGAWQRLIEQYAVFRTFFVRMETQKPLQVVLKQVALPRQELDWTNLDEPERESRLARLRYDEWIAGFNFSAPPLFRLILIRCATDDYRLVWTQHHAITDGWSGALVWSQWRRLYFTACRGEASFANDSAPSFHSYVSWLERQDKTAAVEFWRDSLAGFTEPVALPPGRARSSLPRDVPSQATAERSLGTELSAQLARFVREHTMTLSVLMQGMWAYLLHLFNNRDDIVFGGTVSGRPPEVDGIERMIGPLINSVPVRVRIDAKQSVSEYLRGIFERQKSRAAHEYLSLFDIQKCSQVPSGTGLFESLLVFDNYPRTAGISDASNEPLVIAKAGGYSYNHYPLTLMIVPGKDIALSAKYADDRYSREHVEYFLDVLVALLTSCVTHPERPLGELECLSEAQRGQVLSWSGQGERLQHVETLPERVEQHAARYSQRTAVVSAGGQWSYGELNERSNQLARYLLKLGVRSDQSIAVCVEPSAWMLCGMLAAHKLGASFVMLDGSWPATRLNEVLMDSDAGAIITEQLYLSKIADTEASAQIVSVDRDAEDIAQEESGNIEYPVLPGRAAYMVYTSGSTGRPKGVVVSHRALSHYVSGLLAQLSVGEDPLEWLSLAAMSADLGYTTMFGGLWTGGSIRLMPSSSSLDAEALARSLEQRPVDVLKIVPGHLSALLSVSEAERVLPRRYLVCGGEELPKPLLEDVWSLHPQLRIFNHYGPSETTVGALCGEVTRADFAYERVSIGRPLRHREAYVLDAQLRPVGVGVIGELYLGGEGLADGYRGRPGQTAERFIPHPSRDGARLYKTGDLARYRPDGRVEFLGRGDHQIKRRGYRIELGEIEQMLMKHERIRQAVVLWSQDRLLCYVITELTPAELEEYAQRTLIEVMRPTHWIRMQTYPLLPNGKVDRQALLSREIEQAARPEPAAPRTATESLLASLWQELLKVERIGIHENFFRLGGDSLLIIRLHAAIKKAADRDLQIVDLFQYPTIEKQAQLLDRGPLSIGESAEFKNITRRLARRRVQVDTAPE
ncbi:amino acid adenylation domain-containing protein [Steroidobacter sp. S1-65]|uniref:Amino acid adenylation domain-containing protein n=1 Tax=Steroidobacter gossypii TaxID=2805490 RepID=A0ABS1WZY4_9GAMM|nr:non-ribosomal peptide synthetase [Steroidobacter gossypii]MBM0106534.1 amino acid adenylation domain-containing protein [Steroidobacter gossypii]